MRRVAEAGRQKQDDGAVAVLFALVFVILVGFVGAGIDLASAYAKTQQVQNAADAAAIAIAQECVLSNSCANDEELAEGFASANIQQPLSEISTQISYPGVNRVTVTAEADHKNFFLGLFHQTKFRLSEEATAAWGVPVRGISALPVALSRCEIGAQIDAQLNVTQTILFPKKSETGCTGPSGHFVPGGFAWLMPDVGSECKVASGVEGWEWSDPGKSTPTVCSDSYFRNLIGEVVLIPVFKEYEGTGSNARYKVDGFVAWKFEGYFFSQSYQHNAKCSNPQQCLTGKFVKYVTLDESWEYGTGPDYRASIVALAD